VNQPTAAEESDREGWIGGHRLISSVSSARLENALPPYGFATPVRTVAGPFLRAECPDAMERSDQSTSSRSQGWRCCENDPPTHSRAGGRRPVWCSASAMRPRVWDHLGHLGAQAPLDLEAISPWWRGPGSGRRRGRRGDRCVRAARGKADLRVASRADVASRWQKGRGCTTVGIFPCASGHSSPKEKVLPPCGPGSRSIRRQAFSNLALEN